MIPKMKVVCNPFAKDELAPTVRFEPANGFSIRHGNIKGTWLPEVADAVNDYNVRAQRALKSLRLSSYVSETFPLASLPGIDGAWDAFRRTQGRTVEPPKGCGCGVCQDMKEAFKVPPGSMFTGSVLESLLADMLPNPELQAAKLEALKKLTATAHQEGKAEHERRKRNAPFSLMGLVAMAAAMGALDDLEDVEDKGSPFVLDPHPEIAEALGKAGLLHRTGLNSAVVAIPRKMGEGFCKQLEAAIRSGDLERVKALTVGRKFD